jgi:STE24 endopeptidase
MYDTLLKQVDLSELLAILGHEIGHWKLWHTIQGFVITQLYTFCLFLAFSYVQNTPGLFAAFGFNYTHSAAAPMPVFIGLMLFSQTFWSPVERVLSLLLTFNSRTNEFAADAYAVSLGKGAALASGLIKISIGTLLRRLPYGRLFVLKAVTAPHMFCACDALIFVTAPACCVTHRI